MSEEKSARKIAIICSKGTLDMAYPGLVLANAARQAGIEALLFFTFWGLDMVTKKKMAKMKVTPVGNPAMGMPNALGVIPGMTMMNTGRIFRKPAKRGPFWASAMVFAPNTFWTMVWSAHQ